MFSFSSRRAATSRNRSGPRRRCSRGEGASGGLKAGGHRPDGPRIAHEIHNPLAGIANAFRLVRDAVPKELSPEYRYVERTEKEIERVTRIIELMYDLHRPNQERGGTCQPV